MNIFVFFRYFHFRIFRTGDVKLHRVWSEAHFGISKTAKSEKTENYFLCKPTQLFSQLFHLKNHGKSHFFHFFISRYFCDFLEHFYQKCKFLTFSYYFPTEHFLELVDSAWSGVNHAVPTCSGSLWLECLWAFLVSEPSELIWTCMIFSHVNVSLWHERNVCLLLLGLPELWLQLTDPSWVIDRLLKNNLALRTDFPRPARFINSWKGAKSSWK